MRTYAKDLTCKDCIALNATLLIGCKNVTNSSLTGKHAMFLIIFYDFVMLAIVISLFLYSERNFLLAERFFAIIMSAIAMRLS